MERLLTAARETLQRAIFTVVGTTLGTAAQAQPVAVDGVRPNIVFLYADDLGYGDVGCYGNSSAKTPNLDRLAEHGTLYKQFYVPHAVCSPTRASCVTGQYPSRQRVFGHFAALEANRRRGMPDWLPAECPSMPRTLQQAGYRTAVFGKWHLGGGSGRSFQGKAINSADAPPPQQYGFDEARVVFGNAPTWHGTTAADGPHEVYPYEDRQFMTYSSRLIADETIAFLDRQAKRRQPFLVNVWFSDPHTPISPTPEMREPFQHLSEPSQTHYAAIGEMDKQVGRVLARLDELGLRDQTLVIFTSDNGATHSGGGSNGPLRGFKHALREGGIRVPFIARWPGKVPAGRVDETSVLNLVDFTPTFCRLSGATPPPGYASDGEDITDALLGRPFQRAKPMFWYHPSVRADNSPKLAMRQGRWKLAMEPDGTRAELYDLEADPAEAKDLASERADVVAEMKPALRSFHEAQPPVRPIIADR